MVASDIETTTGAARGYPPYAQPGRGSQLTFELQHAFLTSQGSAYDRFRRALDRGTLLQAMSAAAELKHVALSDALELMLLLARGDPPRFHGAALRRHAR